jgi:hypothetical protein
MKVSRRLAFVVMLAVTASIVVSAAVAATVVIHEGKGPGKARLGQIDTKAAGFLGSHGQLQQDPNYGSRVVYLIDVGTKMANGRFPCEMLSNSGHAVFQFAFNSAAFVTEKGIRVGSSESQLVARYAGMKRNHTTKFNHYVLGGRPFTDFWVLNSSQRVYQIIVRSK